MKTLAPTTDPTWGFTILPDIDLSEFDVNRPLPCPKTKVLYLESDCAQLQLFATLTESILSWTNSTTPRFLDSYAFDVYTSILRDLPRVAIAEVVWVTTSPNPFPWDLITRLR